MNSRTARTDAPRSRLGADLHGVRGRVTVPDERSHVTLVQRRLLAETIINERQSRGDDAILVRS